MKASRHAVAGLLLGLCCCVVAPCMAAKAATSQVEIRNFAFAPNTMTVPVGTRVTWTNRDDEPHVITSAGKQFATSPALDTSDTYAVTFSKPGTYAYYCSIHPMMVGTIIVQ
ncbi:cupredoxin domain-containing protein [Dyella soli]|uniref:EfeO-type cupredoxin-like domain-containing protein n=1 Tax=Dyella soli TaxID=522319 RepID=A0A4R0YV15_9GAMM|nr:cupredoxin family copper-binding protein [Dyella soli]TCI10803.1 hypothetical protein EZM97_18325 [Dyella soli]